MKILINDLNGQNLETISSENLKNLEETLKKFSSMKEPLEINCFAINESITSSQLSKLKNNLNIIKIYFLRIYSNDRNTVLAGKSLKIDSIFLQEKEVRKKLLLLNQKMKEDLLHVEEEKTIIEKFKENDDFEVKKIDNNSIILSTSLDDALNTLRKMNLNECGLKHITKQSNLVRYFNA